jgi:hypothetical protein
MTGWLLMARCWHACDSRPIESSWPAVHRIFIPELHINWCCADAAHLVQILDHYFGNVCELDLVFGFHKVYCILDEFIIGGEIQETSKKVCWCVSCLLLEAGEKHPTACY